MTHPETPPPPPETGTEFAPIPLRARHDGWKPERQVAFIDALAESGCVTEAARAVGMSVRSAYRLRANPDSRAFRLAWDNAIEFAMLRLQDAVVSRAINGVVVPHFYKGEQVGEHRRYDERLAMFLLRTRKSAFYGAHAEEIETIVPPDLYAEELEKAVEYIESGAPLSHPGPEATPEQPQWMPTAPVEVKNAPASAPTAEEMRRAEKIMEQRLEYVAECIEENLRREQAGLPWLDNLPRIWTPPSMRARMEARMNTPPPPGGDGFSEAEVDTQSYPEMDAPLPPKIDLPPELKRPPRPMPRVYVP